MQRFWLLLSLKLCYITNHASQIFTIYGLALLSGTHITPWKTATGWYSTLCTSLISGKTFLQLLLDFLQAVSGFFHVSFFCLFILSLGQNQFCFICSLKSIILFKWEFFLLLSVKYSLVFGVVAVLFWLQYPYPSLGEPGVGWKNANVVGIVISLMVTVGSLVQSCFFNKKYLCSTDFKNSYRYRRSCQNMMDLQALEKKRVDKAKGLCQTL